MMIYVFIILAAACSPARKGQVGQQPVTKAVVTPVISTSDFSKPDSSQIKREVFNKVIRNKIDFTSFSAKAKVEYTANGNSNDATAYVKLLKDSVLWLSLRGPLGIEGVRVLITKDSVKVINYLENNVQLRDINYLEEVASLPFDFATLQDLLIGNSVFIDSNITSISNLDDNKLQVTMEGYIFNHVATFTGTDYRLLESRLSDSDPVQPRTCSIVYSNYDNGAGVPFSTGRHINFTGKSNVELNLEYKSYTFNQAVSFPFNIPDDYKRL